MLEEKVSTLKRCLYVMSGFISIGLALLGILLPLLPTTPFLLLAAFCFARSSRRWHDWLLQQPLLGPYIFAFREKKGLTLEQKWRIAGAITVTLLLSAWLAPLRSVQILVGIIWVGCMAFLYLSRTAQRQIIPTSLRKTTS